MKNLQDAGIIDNLTCVRSLYCVKNVCACNTLHYGKAVMTSPSYFATASLIGYFNMTHFMIQHVENCHVFDICCWHGWQWSRMSELHVAITLTKGGDSPHVITND
jgi:hypothetical protein